MRRRFLPLIALLALWADAAPALAESWLFRPSYYSHDPVTEVRIGPQAVGGPYYTRPRGAYVNSGYRHLHSTIRAGGQSHDHVNVYESWVQVGEQF